MTQKVLISTALFMLFFVMGFLSSLGIHWSIRPSLDATQALTEMMPRVEPSPVEPSLLNRQVIELEDTLAQVQTEYRIDEGHARALIQELQTYRDERDRLFADLEARKQQVISKIEELDGKIQRQLEQRDAQFTDTPDYALENELLGLLSYPHSLNDNALLYQRMTSQISRHQELIETRFALILQPVDYAHTDHLYQILEPVIEQLNKAHNNETELLTAHCSDRICEIQIRLKVMDPYFDYWQQWISELRALNETKLILHEITATEGAVVTGAVIIKRLDGRK